MAISEYSRLKKEFLFQVSIFKFCRKRKTRNLKKLETKKQKMKVTEHIENANGKPLFSFEIFPP